MARCVVLVHLTAGMRIGYDMSNEGAGLVGRSSAFDGALKMFLAGADGTVRAGLPIGSR